MGGACLDVTLGVCNWRSQESGRKPTLFQEPAKVCKYADGRISRTWGLFLNADFTLDVWPHTPEGNKSFLARLIAKGAVAHEPKQVETFPSRLLRSEISPLSAQQKGMDGERRRESLVCLCSSGPPVVWLLCLHCMTMTHRNQKMDKPWWRENWELGNHQPKAAGLFGHPIVLCGFGSDSVPNAAFQLFLISPIHDFQQTNKDMTAIQSCWQNIFLEEVCSIRRPCVNLNEKRTFFMECIRMPLF